MKSKETFLKTEASFRMKGDKLWAKACEARDKGDAAKATNLFGSARLAYSTADKAKASAAKAK
jgi:hypothetical protein